MNFRIMNVSHILWLIISTDSACTIKIQYFNGNVHLIAIYDRKNYSTKNVIEPQFVFIVFFSRLKLTEKKEEFMRQARKSNQTVTMQYKMKKKTEPNAIDDSLNERTLFFD